MLWASINEWLNTRPLSRLRKYFYLLPTCYNPLRDGAQKCHLWAPKINKSRDTGKQRDPLMDLETAETINRRFLDEAEDQSRARLAAAVMATGWPQRFAQSCGAFFFSCCRQISCLSHGALLSLSAAATFHADIRDEALETLHYLSLSFSLTT